MLKFAICDDEPAMVKELSCHLSRYMTEKNRPSYQISTFAGGRSLLESASSFYFIFLYIHIEKPDGMDTGKIDTAFWSLSRF